MFFFLGLFTVYTEKGVICYTNVDFFFSFTSFLWEIGYYGPKNSLAPYGVA